MHGPVSRTDEQHAIASWGALSFHDNWVWRWKDQIDRKFMARYLPPWQRQQAATASFRVRHVRPFAPYAAFFTPGSTHRDLCPPSQDRERAFKRRHPRRVSWIKHTPRFFFVDVHAPREF